MTKELVIERYGPLKYTMGNGGSAASMQQHLLAENYPGLLDGLTTSQVFEDHWTQVQGSFDCRVLMHYFWPTSPLRQPGPRDRAAERAVPDGGRRGCRCGAATPTNPDNLCGQKVISFGADRTELVPTANVACGLRPAQLWNPVSNPTGERCGIADFMRSIFGVTVTPDAPNGKGRLAVDNVGVQYGLLALQRGEITPEQFVDLNAKVGGIDIDGNFVAAAHERRPGGAADRLRDRPRQQRHGRDGHPRDRQPHRRPDGRHGLPSRVPLVLLPRAPRQGQRPPRQPGDLALAAGRRGAEPVRPHAPVARQRRQAGDAARRLLHGRRRRGRPDVQRHLDVLRSAAARGGLAAEPGRRQVPAQAAGPSRLRPDRLHRRAVGAVAGHVPGRRLRLLAARCRASSRRRPAG